MKQISHTPYAILALFQVQNENQGIKNVFLLWVATQVPVEKREK